MENKKLKNLELTDDQLEQTIGGTTNGDGFQVLIPTISLINEDDFSVEPIEEVTPSLP